MTPTTSPITTVHSQPSTSSPQGSVNRPITLGAVPITIITPIGGTATTPLITADQNSPFTGSISMKLIATPISVATTMVP